MKKMKVFLFAVLVAFAGVNSGYSQVTLQECQALARENYPAIKRYDLVAQSERYKLSEIGRGWLPQGSVGAKATYQSTVTSVDLPVPNMAMPSLSKLQYQATVDVSQVLWDGGQMRAAKDGVRASSGADVASVEVDMYAIRERVNEMYFGVLLASEQLAVNGTYIDNLQENLQKVEALRVNGVSSQADVDAVRVGIVQARQDRVSMEYSRDIYVGMLSQMVGRELGVSDFVVPASFSVDTVSNNRPELSLFDARVSANDARLKRLNASVMPTFSAFGQVGVGLPGMNMFSSSLGNWAMGGLRMNWNFGAFYTKKDVREQVAVDAQTIENGREVFLYNIDLQKEQQMGLIESYRAAMRDDDEIISLRESVERASSVKMEQGVIGASDFMRDALSTQMARQNKAAREMQLLKQIYTLKNTLNN